MFKRKKIGLALSGGGARGLAHIGVLKVLEEENIPIDMISGTSMGAVIAAIYSAEPNAKKLKKEAIEGNYKKLLDYTLSTKGIIKGKKIEEFLKKKLDHIKFGELKIPLYITAYDLENNQEIIFSKGDVAKAIRASISIPGIFQPVENNEKILVDGGIVDPVPSEILAEKKAEVIIASNVNYIERKKPLIDQEAIIKPSKRSIPNAIKCSTKSLQVMNSEIARSDVKKNNIDLKINIDLEDVGIFDFENIEKIIETGERTTRTLLKEIKKLTKNPLSRLLENIKDTLILKEHKYQRE